MATSSSVPRRIMELDEEIMPKRSTIPDTGVTRVSTRGPENLIFDSKLDMKRYKNLLRKSYQLKVRPSIIRAKGVKNTLRLPKLIRTISSFRPAENLHSAETHFAPISSISSTRESRNSSDEAFTEEEVPERAESAFSEKNDELQDSLLESCQSFSRIFRESWSVLTEESWYPGASYHDCLDRTEIDVSGAIQIAKYSDNSRDECCQGSHLEANSDTCVTLNGSSITSKKRNYSFDKYKLVCPNQVMGKTRSLT